MTREQKLDTTVVVLVLWIYIHLIIFLMPAAELKDIAEIKLSLFRLLYVYIFYVLLSIDRRKFNPEDYCDVDLNNLSDLEWYQYNVYASEERKRRDINLLYQTPPENIIKTKDHKIVVRPLDKSNSNIMTHVLLGDIFEAKPGDIIFTDTEELMVVTTKVTPVVQGINLITAGCIKMNDI